MKKNQYLLFLFLWPLLPLLAQDYDFDILSVEDGLSQSSVTCITQDDKGFVWIGTRDGLNRYDGYDIEVYRKIPFDSTSLISNSIISLLAEPEGLWVGTIGGLQWYNWKTKKFERIELFEDDKPPSITTIFRDNFGGIWIGTANGFFSVRKDKDQKRFITQSYFQREENEHNDDHLTLRVTSFLHDRQGRFWIASSEGIFQFYFDSNRNLIIEKDLRLPPEEYCKASMSFKALLEHSDGTVYGSSSNEIFHYKEENDEFGHFFTIGKEQSRDVTITQLSEFLDGQIVATTALGLQSITTDHGEIVSSRFLTLPTKGVSAIRDKINFLHCDNIYENLYWLATDIGGVVKMYRKQKQFKTQLLKDIPGIGMNNPYLRHIAGDDNHIWYNLGQQIMVEDRKDHTFQVFKNIYPSQIYGSNSTISFVLLTQEEKIIIGLANEIKELWIDEKGNQKSKSFSLEADCISKANSIFETPKYFILGGLNGNVSIVEKAGLSGVACLDFSESLAILGKKEIYSLLMDSQSNLWIGTSNGLVLYQGIVLGEEAFIPPPKYFCYNPDDTTSLIENKITHLLEDANHNVWISTRNGVMNAKITNGKVELKRIEAEGLQQQVIYGILEDKENEKLWMSTNAGLFTYELGTGRVDHFNAKDGLQGNEFNTASFFKSKTGELFFGGPKGLTHFYPKEIELNEQAPPVWFTELRTPDDKKVDLINFDKTETLFLDYWQRSFSIRFIGLDFFQSNELHYFYELIGETDTQEASLGNSRQINFSQLRPGNYSLLIRAINKDGAFSQEGDTLRFTIRAPFWKMMWFYLLITALIIGLFWLAFYLRYRNKMKRLDAIETVRKSIAEDFHDEMGSKLSIISMYSEFTKNELADQGGKAAQYIDKVNTTAARLYENTRDLIWVLNPQNDTLYDLYLQLKDFGEELFNDTGINFHSSGISDLFKDENLPIRYKRHLLLIFKEAMHNSLKHADCQNIELSIKQQKGGFTFILQDDGEGFDTDSIYKGDGLKNMRHRAKQINSELHFLSKKEGTRIWLEIQKSNT